MMDKDVGRFTELAERCEAATANERRLFIEIGQAVWGSGLDNIKAKHLDFESFVVGGAYLEAAIVIAPEGWLVRHLSQWNESWTVSLAWPGRKYRQVDAEARTAALALCAATLRARAQTPAGDA